MVYAVYTLHTGLTLSCRTFSFSQRPTHAEIAQITGAGSSNPESGSDPEIQRLKLRKLLSLRSKVPLVTVIGERWIRITQRQCKESFPADQVKFAF
ncbi:Hypothetical predicted protein [Pelobates cultripes]|uniref:Uncharacterized protein n=1 Tax=Pelobates cultripes TaxID=61616 RepID=A0AAD1SRI6_PELCU|nr:Hypothetical predicted protein [Pelobates cultripes]